MEFEVYLASKRIDSIRFSSAEPELWQSWKSEFEQLHPNSFTVQKLNLINPIRRKYQLTVVESPKVVAPPVVKPASPTIKVAIASTTDGDAPAVAKAMPRIPRPGMPKPVVRPSADANSIPVIRDSQDASTEQTKEITNPVGDVDRSVVPGSTATTLSGEEVAAKAPGSADAEVVGDAGDPTPTSDATSRQTSMAPEQSTVKTDSEKSPTTPPASENTVPPVKPARPVIPRPVIKPKPKPN